MTLSRSFIGSVAVLVLLLFYCYNIYCLYLDRLMRLGFVVVVLSMVAFLSRVSRAAFTNTRRYRPSRIAPFHQASAAMEQAAKFWNREESPKQSYAAEAPIIKQAKIISLSSSDDDANAAVNEGELPKGASLLAIGSSIHDFDIPTLEKEEPNVIFVAHPEVRKMAYCTVVYYGMDHVLGARGEISCIFALTFLYSHTHV